MVILFIYFSVGFTFVKEVVMFFPVIFSSIAILKPRIFKYMSYLCAATISQLS